MMTELEPTMMSSPSPSRNLESQEGGGSMERAQNRTVTDLERIVKARASVNPEPTSVVVLVSTSVLDSTGKTLDSRASDYPDLKVGEDESTDIVSACKGSTKRSHHYLAIFIGWFLGNAMLFLWNAILNAGDYFYSVFPDYHPSRVFPLLYILVALVLSCGFVVLAQDQGSIRWRVLNGFSVFFAAAICIIIASAGEGAHWLETRFTFIAISTLVVLSGIGEGICGGGLLGEFSFMDPVYLQAFNAGLAASGIATTGLRMITKCIFGDTVRGLRNGCLTFFAIAALVHLAGIFAYAIVFPRLEGVRTYRLHAVAQGSNLTVSFVDASVDDFEPGNDSGRKVVSEKKDHRERSKLDLVYENWDYVLDTVILYAVTFSINPGFLYENTGSHSLGSWYPLVLLAIFNAADFLSRIVRIEKLFVRSRRALGVCCCGLVLLFIPGFYFGARYGGTALMMVLCGLLGATNGYFTVCIFDNAPVGFKAPEQSVIGAMLYISTLVGLTIGLGANWFWLIH